MEIQLQEFYNIKRNMMDLTQNHQLTKRWSSPHEKKYTENKNKTLSLTQQQDITFGTLELNENM